jgi:hypothetical protein
VRSELQKGCARCGPNHSPRVPSPFYGGAKVTILLSPRTRGRDLFMESEKSGYFSVPARGVSLSGVQQWRRRWFLPNRSLSGPARKP